MNLSNSQSSPAEMANFINKVKSFLAAVSVEPVAFIYCFTFFVFSSSATNMYLQKACMPDAPPLDTDVVCHDTKALGLSADINTLRMMVKALLPGVSVLVAGVWRDRTGTKPLLLLPIFGEMLAAAVALLGFFYWSTSSWIFVAAESVIGGASGGLSMVLMSSYCLVIENSTEENRTSRISYLITAIMFSSIAANGTTGLLLSTFGYRYVYIVIIGLHALSAFLTFILIKDKPKECKKDEIKTPFKLSTVKSVCCDSGENMICIWLILIGYVAVETTYMGEVNVVLYFMEKQFNYNVTETGYYNSYRTAISGVFSFILSQMMSKVIKMSDFKIAIISGLLTFIGAVSMAFAKTFLDLILFAFFDILKPTLITVLRSILSKLLYPEKLGVFFGMMSAVEAVLPLAVLPLYDMVFNATLRTSPGAFYLISAALKLITFICACVTFWIYEEPSSNDDKKPSSNEGSISDWEKHVVILENLNEKDRCKN